MGGPGPGKRQVCVAFTFEEWDAIVRFCDSDGITAVAHGVHQLVLQRLAANPEIPLISEANMRLRSHMNIYVRRRLGNFFKALAKELDAEADQAHQEYESMYGRNAGG